MAPVMKVIGRRMNIVVKGNSGEKLNNMRVIGIRV